MPAWSAPATPAMPALKGRVKLKTNSAKLSLKEGTMAGLYYSSDYCGLHYFFSHTE